MLLNSLTKDRWEFNFRPPVLCFLLGCATEPQGRNVTLQRLVKSHWVICELDDGIVNLRGGLIKCGQKTSYECFKRLINEIGKLSYRPTI